MIIKEIKTITQEVESKIKCDVCGFETEYNTFDYHNFQKIYHSSNFNSKKFIEDEDFYIEMCESCFYAMMSSFLLSRDKNINNFIDISSRKEEENIFAFDD